MGRRHEVAIIPREYPTDDQGVPINPYELGDGFTLAKNTLERTNNHHFNFYARSFGSLAIAQTFRDLNVMQSEMRISQHQRLHQLYTGIDVPSLDVMMNIIEEEKDREVVFNDDRALKIYNQDLKRYEYFDITDLRWDFLQSEYSRKIGLYGTKKTVNL